MIAVATTALVTGIDPGAMAALVSTLASAGVTVVHDAGDEPPGLAFVGDLATARGLVDVIDPSRMALVVPFLDRHVEEAAYTMRVRPLVADDAEGILRFVHGHTVADPEEPASGHRWWGRRPARA